MRMMAACPLAHIDRQAHEARADLNRPVSASRTPGFLRSGSFVGGRHHGVMTRVFLVQFQEFPLCPGSEHLGVRSQGAMHP